MQIKIQRNQNKIPAKLFERKKNKQALIDARNKQSQEVIKQKKAEEMSRDRKVNKYQNGLK